MGLLPALFPFTNAAAAVADNNLSAPKPEKLIKFFGDGEMFEPGDYKDHYKYGGIKHLANYPMPKPLFSRTSYTYPTYNMAIPDQFRVDIFKKEFEEKKNFIKLKDKSCNMKFQL